MKLLSSIDEVPELLRGNVHISDKELLLEKLNKMIKGGSSKLQIVTDFDHTLTRHKMDNGKPVLTSFGMFRECPSVPQRYKDEDSRLAAVYKPIEADARMPLADKTRHMVDWYVAAHQLLKGVKFPRQELMDIATKMTDCFRTGAAGLVAWSARRRTPVLVFSAGLGEAVRAALAAAGFLMPHVKIVSNFLELDESDTIVGIKGDVIHTYNKNETAIRDTEYYALVRERSSVLLMGDNVGDAGMTQGMAHCDVVVKVGFLGHSADNLPNYLRHFDVVLVDDHTMDVPNAILKLL